MRATHVRRLVAASLAATVLAAAPLALPAQSTLSTASAQEVPLGTFNGRVDKEVQLTMRGGTVTGSTLSGDQLRSRFRLASPLPAQEGTVRVAVTNGRGDVSVVQQPTAANGYTAIIRIYDRSGGADVYRFTTYFTPTLTTSDGRRGGRFGRGARANLPVLRWTGDVDGTAEIIWRGGTVQSRIVNGRLTRNVALRNTGDLSPLRSGAIADAQVVVTPREGRGSVEVIQQPTAQNRYTTIIRISDPAGGYGHYNFEAAFR